MDHHPETEEPPSLPPPPSCSPSGDGPSHPTPTPTVMMIKQEEQEQNGAEVVEDDGAIVAALFAVAEARSAAADLSSRLAELRVLRRDNRRDAELEAECELTERRLEEEKRMHEDELRQIDKDITALDNLISRRKADQERKRRELTQKMELLRKRVAEAPSDGMIMMKRMKDEEEDHPPQPSASFHNQHQFFLWAFQWFLLLHQHQQQQQQQVAATPARRPMLPVPHTTSQQAKMKACLNCFETIHRNAPTCPHCKCKIISKASKMKGAKVKK